VSHFTKTIRGVAVAALTLVASSAFAQQELKIMAPAGPGGGWDSAARSIQQVLTQTGLAKSVQVTNVTGAGGTIGLAQFVNNGKGDPNQLMVNGITMIGAILSNKSPVGLEQVTPIARLTGDPLVIVVPANSPIKNVQELAAANVPASKAGSVTHFEGETVVENVRHYLAGEPLEPGFDGHANCFIETGFHKALLIDFNYDVEPLPGRFPEPHLGPLPLLKESRLNHMAKLAFQWVYWHMLLPGRDMPGISSQLQLAGKDTSLLLTTEGDPR